MRESVRIIGLYKVLIITAENNGTEWTEEEIQYIKDNWESKSYKEIAEHLKRTFRSVKAERVLIGIRRNEARPRHNLEEVKKLFEDRDYELLTSEYKNTTTPLEYICKKHFEKGILKITLRDFLSGKGCRYCGFERSAKAKMHSDDFYKQRCEDLGLEYVGRYVDEDHTSVIQYICPKHKDKGVQHKSISCINVNAGCPYCKNLKNEKNLASLLATLGFKVETQKRFSDCRFKNPLPFDFYLPDFNILIEFDGEFHYMPIRKGSMTDEEAIEQMKNTQQRDQIKTQYCKDNNSPLIRIPYWEKDNMEQFLLQKFKELSVNFDGKENI